MRDGFCAFEFNATRRALLALAAEQPLAVEVWARREMARDEMLGVATVWIGSVFDQAPRYLVRDGVTDRVRAPPRRLPRARRHRC
ncbi:hypothetical protein, partial [Brevundimonas sp.]|uniref:hypothetical protein n=1 Tax=Brevundimonas sp. TaxID=1871086 RepID=UPI003919CBBC